MFDIFNDKIIAIGELADVLDGLAPLATPLRYKFLDEERFEIEMAFTLHYQQIVYSKKYSGFILPTTMSPFASTWIDSLPYNGPIRKVLIATTEFTHDTNFGGASRNYPVLRGCTQLLPFSSDEKLICGIRGITYGE